MLSNISNTHRLSASLSALGEPWNWLLTFSRLTFCPFFRFKYKDGFINYRSNEEFTNEKDVADFGCTGGCSSLG